MGITLCNRYYVCLNMLLMENDVYNLIFLKYHITLCFNANYLPV